MEIRAAHAGDVEQLAAVHIRSWQDGYRGLLPQKLLDGFYAALGFRPDGATRTDRYGGQDALERRLRQTLGPGPGSPSDHRAG